jgi:hypothetical protein
MEKPHIALQLIPTLEEGKAFLLARGGAIGAYALVEQELFALFSHLMNVPMDYAGVPFFRINNARARNAILSRLLRKRHGSAYNIFFNSLITSHLQQMDEKRNQIVHWAIWLNVVESPNGEQKLHSSLNPPNYWDWAEGSPKIYINEIYDFIVKCDFLSHLINMFGATISGQWEKTQVQGGGASEATWREIFRQPVTYPPPCNHPLYRTQ